MNNSLVSILMPVYNAAPYLDACLASIVAQSYPFWELIAVDDFSTDNSPEIIDEWEQKDSRIQLIKNTEKGIVPALQNAFECAKGKLITRMDSDDLMPQNKLELFVQAIGNSRSLLVTGKVNYFSNLGEVSEGYSRYEEWINKLVDNRSHWEFVYRECVIASPNWLVHREFFEKCISFGQLKYPEDYDLVFQWHKFGLTIKGIDEITHLWREHPARTSRNSDVYQQKSFFKLKTHYFIENELSGGDSVQLVGAGQKGKIVAEILIEHQIDFTWFDLNAGAYKGKVFGKSIVDVNGLEESRKTILTVWPKEEYLQKQITSFLNNKGLHSGENYWLF